MFNPYLSPCQDVSRQFDLGEVALANGFEQPVIANMRLLVSTRGNGVAASSPGAAGSRGTIVSTVTVRGVLEIKHTHNRSSVIKSLKGDTLAGQKKKKVKNTAT